MMHILKEYLQFGWNVVIAVILTFFFIGINFNKLVLPEAAFAPVIVLLTVYGVISFSSFVYYTSCEWTEVNNQIKSKKLLKVAGLALLLAVQILLLSKVLMIFFGS